jgi:hypothetical protein
MTGSAEFWPHKSVIAAQAQKQSLKDSLSLQVLVSSCFGFLGY